MPPRRSHKKSRAGCRRCKSRKIKCDEIRPRCHNCEKHGVACDFEFPEIANEFAAQTPRPSYAATPGATPLPSADTPITPVLSNAFPSSATLARLGRPPTASVPLSIPQALALTAPGTPSAASRLLELRLLHHYSTSTFKTLSCDNPSAEKVWRDTVPRVAFEAASGSNHLTDAVLAVAALHLRSEFPQDRELIRASHAYMASSLSEYNRLLQRGINALNAEALFLNSTLIAFQSTATRIFSKDEPASRNGGIGLHPDPYTFSHMSVGTNGGSYGLPMSWFHAFQGVKAITAASWPWLRRSDVVLPIINAQPALHLDIASAKDGFFGHLLDGLDEELATLHKPASESTCNFNGNNNRHHSPGCVCTMGSDRAEELRRIRESNILPSQQLSDILQDSFHTADDPDEGARNRHAYQHAVAVLNWAHGIRHSGAFLAFPATVSRRFVELLSQRTPRALTILACFFAMLKTVDSIWWLHGMARREVLGVVSMFNLDNVPVDVERHWWPHMQWAVRVALYHDDDHPSDYVPPEIWGAPWVDPSDTNSSSPGPESYVSHIDMITEAINSGGSVPDFGDFDFSRTAL
ncbi:c6 zinc finger domain containing protein [Ophiostoma piceae UAMH 11346]|uniref:C6 zinc finger domain containing protein n=1 Tax=Ophiostoma piceae (strain UAMH 11346) TaxID=1262450 RepID=S3C7U3_OPHP1|nr:c6 zinc finger domain containing protein [Ophiostoma piceae UAMH 11346]